MALDRGDVMREEARLRAGLLERCARLGDGLVLDDVGEGDVVAGLRERDGRWRGRCRGVRR